jgi:hypothetical protein
VPVSGEWLMVYRYGEAKQAEAISQTRTEANRFKASPGWVDHAAGRDA